MSQETGKEKQTEKQVTDSQETVESLKAKLKAVEDEKASLLKETMSRKEKLEALEAENKKAEAARLAEQGKYKELYESLTPQADRLKVVLQKLDSIYAQEIADIPEDKRDLIPSLDIEARLDWVRQAKAKGLFAAPQGDGKKPPLPSVQSKTSPQAQGLPDFVTWGADDPRVAKLSVEDMLIWKKHRQAQKPLAIWGASRK